MDRIFINVKTKQTLISAENGMMPSDADWVQIGTIDLTLVPSENFKGRIQIS